MEYAAAIIESIKGLPPIVASVLGFLATILALSWLFREKINSTDFTKVLESHRDSQDVVDKALAAQSAILNGIMQSVTTLSVTAATREAQMAIEQRLDEMCSRIERLEKDNEQLIKSQCASDSCPNRQRRATDPK